MSAAEPLSGSDRLSDLPRLPRDEGGPVFAEPWQAQAFALAVKLSEQGHFTWKEWAASLAEELQAALRTPVLFDRWRAKQEDPDKIDPTLGATDPAATVTGEDKHLDVWLVATTSLPGSLFKQRMRWLAGSNWQLSDVRAV